MPFAIPAFSRTTRRFFNFKIFQASNNIWLDLRLYLPWYVKRLRAVGFDKDISRWTLGRLLVRADLESWWRPSRSPHRVGGGNPELILRPGVKHVNPGPVGRRAFGSHCVPFRGFPCVCRKLVMVWSLYTWRRSWSMISNDLNSTA